MSEEQPTSTEATPSVKGSVFLIGVQGVKRLVADGRLSREEVEFELRAEDIGYLDEKILPASWYPVTSFDRFAAIAIDSLGDGDSAYLVEQGEAAAPAILASEAYQGVIGSIQAGREGTRSRLSMLTMVQLMLNFSRWQLDSESGGGQRFEVRVSDAGDLPESLRYAAQGFMQHLASVLAGGPCSVSSERLDQDTILFRGHRRA